MGRFPSRWHAAESLSPAGSYNYSSSVLAADVRAIFRLAKMTSPPNWHVCILGCLWLHTLLWQKDRWPICGPCVHSEISTDQQHQTGSVVTDGGWLSSIAKKDESWLPDRAAKFSLCCWACAGAHFQKMRVMVDMSDSATKTCYPSLRTYLAIQYLNIK